MYPSLQTWTFLIACAGIARFGFSDESVRRITRYWRESKFVFKWSHINCWHVLTKHGLCMQNMCGHSELRISLASSPVWAGIRTIIYFVLQGRCPNFWPTAPQLASFLARTQKVTASPKLSAPIGRWISKLALLDAWMVSSLNFQKIPSNGNKELAKAHCFQVKRHLIRKVIPRLTKIIRSGITFVRRNYSLAEKWFPVGFYRKSFNSFWMLPTI